MKQRLLALGLAAGCILLGAAAFFLYIGQDRTPPKIRVEERDITYTEGSDYSGLLEGVTAEDNRDGDLTEEIFIDRIVPLENGKAVVYYGVMDKKRNVGTASRKVAYTTQDQPEEGQPEPEEDPSEEGDSPENLDKSGEEPKEESPDETKELKPDGVRPAIALTADEAEIKAGEPFDALSFVEAVADDKDDQDTLYRHVHVDGRYDVNTKGTYELRYYVSDSEGNTSDVKTFSLTVQ